MATGRHVISVTTGRDFPHDLRDGRESRSLVELIGTSGNKDNSTRLAAEPDYATDSP